MAQEILLRKSRSSLFSGSTKKFLVILFILGLTLATGFYLYSKDTNGEIAGSLSELPEPDLVPVTWLEKYFGTTDPNDLKIGGYYGDPDGDKLTNYQEYLYATDPTNRDTDGDGYFDGTEVSYASSPLGQGVEKAYQQAEKKLRAAGFDVNREEITKEFEDYLDADRKPEFLEINDSQLIISEDNSKQAVNDYLSRFKEITSYESSNEVNLMMASLFEIYPADKIGEFINKQDKLIKDLIALPIPSDFVAMHKTYIKIYSAMLGMGKYAKLQKEQSNLVDTGKFYPEINFIMSLNDALIQQKSEAFNKHSIQL